MTSPTLHLRLRLATASRHDAVEHLLNLDDRLGSLTAYAAMLRKLHVAHEALERGLRDVAQLCPGLDLDARLQKTAWLAQDLGQLGCDTPPAAPVGPGMAVRSLGAILGCLYVVEGSTLGGRVIAKRVRAGLGLGPDTGGRFFHGYGADSARFWKDFIAALNHHPAQSRIADEAEASAMQTFSQFDRAFSP